MINLLAVTRGHQKVTEELLNLCTTRVGTYGTDRYDMAHDGDFKLSATFFDCHRKMTRLKHMFTKGRVPPQEAREEFRDLANYAILAVQQIDDYEGQRQF